MAFTAKLKGDLFFLILGNHILLDTGQCSFFPDLLNYSFPCLMLRLEKFIFCPVSILAIPMEFCPSAKLYHAIFSCIFYLPTSISVGDTPVIQLHERAGWVNISVTLQTSFPVRHSSQQLPHVSMTVYQNCVAEHTHCTTSPSPTHPISGKPPRANIFQGLS